MRRSGGAIGLILLALGVAFIAIATLVPVPGGRSSPGICIICGDRGGSDFLSNVILFGPLGFALAVRRVSFPLAVIAGGLFSLGVEVAQVGIVTGRDASLGDLIANTFGTGLGWNSFGLGRWLLRDGSSRRALGAAGVTAMILLGGLALFHPSPPDSDTYYMQWRMRFRNMDVYEGEVLSSRIGPLSLRGGRIAETDSVRSMLFTEPLVVEGIAGPPPRRTAPIISIYDREQRQVMLLGARGEDLVYRYRARGDRFLVDRVTVRVADAFAGLSEGEPFRLDWRADARGYCLELDQTRRCGHGLTVGDTWSIVHFIDRPPAERAVIQAIWLWMAFIPGGLAVATPLSLAGATVLAAGTLLAGAPLLGFAVTPLHQVLGAALGLVTGAIVRRVLRGDSRSDKLLSRNLERLSERV